MLIFFPQTQMLLWILQLEIKHLEKQAPRAILFYPFPDFSILFGLEKKKTQALAFPYLLTH